MWLALGLLAAGPALPAQLAGSPWVGGRELTGKPSGRPAGQGFRGGPSRASEAWSGGRHRLQVESPRPGLPSPSSRRSFAPGGGFGGGGNQTRPGWSPGENLGWWLVGGVGLGLQVGLWAALVWERRRRRRCEETTRRLGRQLVDAGEEERHRVARLLHGEFSPRMAGLELDARRLEDAHRWLVPELVSLRAKIGCLVRDLQALASPLPPAVPNELGLEEAVRRECQVLAREQGGPVDFRAQEVPADLPAEVALGLFRVVQESLQNVRRHARATRVTVELVRAGDVLSLKVEDNGQGFLEREARERGHLGIMSMRERVAGLGGGFHLHSRPGLGTRVSTWVRLSRVRQRASRGSGSVPDRRPASGRPADPAPGTDTLTLGPDPGRLSRPIRRGPWVATSTGRSGEA